MSYLPPLNRLYQFTSGPEPIHDYPSPTKPGLLSTVLQASPVCSAALFSSTSHLSFPSSLHSRMSLSSYPLPELFLLCDTLFSLLRGDLLSTHPPLTQARGLLCLAPINSCVPSSLSHGKPCAKPDLIICTPLPARPPGPHTPSLCLLPMNLMNGGK